MSVHEEVSLTGPLFSGADRVKMAEAMTTIRAEVAKRADEEVRAAMKSTFKHPTGYYESQVTVHNTEEGALVDDGGVIYGPWLEGTGSRNETTRFKGYHNFRRTAQKMQGVAAAMANEIIHGIAGRL